jgi:hypothetical protein
MAAHARDRAEVAQGDRLAHTLSLLLDVDDRLPVQRRRPLEVALGHGDRRELGDGPAGFARVTDLDVQVVRAAPEALGLVDVACR